MGFVWHYNNEQTVKVVGGIMDMNGLVPVLMAYAFVPTSKGKNTIYTVLYISIAEWVV